MRMTRPGRGVGVLSVMILGVIAALAVMAVIAYQR
jgi:hypothetical protein